MVLYTLFEALASPDNKVRIEHPELHVGSAHAVPPGAYVAPAALGTDVLLVHCDACLYSMHRNPYTTAHVSLSGFVPLDVGVFS